MSVGMTIYELKQYSEERKPMEISFLSDEQSWTEHCDPLMIRAVFDRMTVVQNPKQVYLTNNGAQLRVGRISRIEFENNIYHDCYMGDLITIFCRDRFGKELPIKLFVS